MISPSIPHACVTGHPIAHSRSPIIHSYWLKMLGLSGIYDRADVLPQNFGTFITTLSERGFVGCNVTLPHKEAAYRLLDRATARADLLKACNTIWIENGLICGDNTDIEGFVANLDDRQPKWDQKLQKAVVLGAGGAAGAILAGLLERGADHIIVANRTIDRAQTLAERFGEHVKAASWDDLPDALIEADVLVNTTSLGMKGQPALEIDLSPLPLSALVTDIVYVPLETDLLRVARIRGNRVADGLGMLLHQAVPGFEHWFGKRPHVTAELRQLIEADIVKAQA